MQVRVTQSFPYSPRGWDNALAAVGVQELPDHIAAIALAEGWAERVDDVRAEPETMVVRAKPVRPRKAVK